MRILTDKLPEHATPDRSKAQRILEVARLLHEARKPGGVHFTQKDVAERLNMKQNRVSDYNAHALQLGVVQVRINPPRALELEQKLLALAQPFGISDVLVVPPGGGRRNEAHLGPAGAWLLLAAIRTVAENKTPSRSGKVTVRLTVSCGATLRAIVQHILKLARSGESFGRCQELEVYPSTLCTGYEVNAIYPATLSSTLGIMWPKEQPDLPVLRAYTAYLPSGFYSEKKKSGRSVIESDLKALVTGASQADIFLIGIGHSKDEDYREIVKQFHIPALKNKALWKSHRLEILYVPVSDEGEAHPEVEEGIFGIGCRTLRAAAGQSPKRFVIGTIGGSEKAQARLLNPAIRSRSFDVILCDEEVATTALSTKR